MECSFCLQVEGPINFWKGVGGRYKYGLIRWILKFISHLIEELSCVTPSNSHIIALMSTFFFTP